MASITTWTRLEPRSERPDLADALAARLHDPLWQLARQWQIGEFTAEDTGSPVQVRVRIEQSPLTRLRLGSDGSAAIAYDPVAVPLEAMIEAEAPVLHRRFAAVAGNHLVDLLIRAGLAAHVAAVTEAFPLTPPSPDVPLDGASQRFLLVAAGRLPDGIAVRAACGSAAAPAVPAVTGVPAGDPAFAAAIVDFVRWYDAAVGATTGAGTPPSWQRDRMEYRFAVAGPAPGGEIMLDAPEHVGGRLDWTVFERRRGGKLGASADATKARVVTRTVIPTRVTYRGMPAARWWEFEDSRCDFGQVEAGPNDLLKMLMLSFALEYGNDWFVAPVELDVGAVYRIRSVTCTDSFGRRTLVRAASVVDGTRRDWRIFSPSPAGAPPAAGTPDDSPELLVLAPSIATAIGGDAVEDVLLVRDELANVAWAVERRVEDAVGATIDRTATRRPQPTPPDGDGSALRYRLATTVPAHWLPLVPVRADPARPDIVLRRGRVLLDIDGAPVVPAALGRVLDAGQPLDIREDEVPRSGVHITRHHQLARWIGGTTHHWIGRRKAAGLGEAWSGLRFDVVEPAD